MNESFHNCEWIVNFFIVFRHCLAYFVCGIGWWSVLLPTSGRLCKPFPKLDEKLGSKLLWRWGISHKGLGHDSNRGIDELFIPVFK